MQSVLLRILFLLLSSSSVVVAQQESNLGLRVRTSIKDSLHFFKKSGLVALGDTQSEKKIDIQSLINIIEGSEITFVNSEVILKPVGANRFSGFSDPFKKTATINSSDPLLEAMMRPLALHEFLVMLPLGFGIRGINDLEYELSLLMDAYISFSQNWNPSVLLVGVVEKKSHILKILENAMNTQIQKSFSDDYVKNGSVLVLNTANNRMYLPDGGSGVGNGGDTRDIYFKQAILDGFLKHIARSNQSIPNNAADFILDIVNMKVQVMTNANVSNKGHLKFYTSARTRMLKYVTLPNMGFLFMKAVMISVDYTNMVWDWSNGYSWFTGIPGIDCMTYNKQIPAFSPSVLGGSVGRSGQVLAGLPTSLGQSGKETLYLDERVFDIKSNTLIEKCAQ